MLRLNRVTNTLVSPLRIFLHLVRARWVLALALDWLSSRANNVN